LYAGEQFDPDLSLYYNRARYLDVRTGRFWTLDIVKDNLYRPLGLHLYIYADSDPANHADPTGTTTVAEQSVNLAALRALINFTTLVSLAAVLPKFKVELELPFRANHYTRWLVVSRIMMFGISSPRGENFVTTDFYFSARTAKASGKGKGGKGKGDILVFPCRRQWPAGASTHASHWTGLRGRILLPRPESRQRPSYRLPQRF
jgi:RHS repeat-associated protein